MQIEAGVAQSDDALVFSFQCCYPRASGATEILLPVPTGPIACDNLWQHTCCEAFVSAADDGDGYLEFNFSPSGCWAIYQFDAYRVRDESYICPYVPKIELKQLPDELAPLSDSIYKRVQSIYDSKALDDMIDNGSKPQTPVNTLNDNFSKKEFL